MADIKINIEIFGITTLNGFIDRIYAPLSADAILDKMPIVMRGRFSFGSKKYWTLPGLGLREGTNPKSVKDVEKGELVYNPKTDELILIIENLEMPNKVNKVGKIEINEDILNARNGLTTKISKS
ncbi:MAG: hypothetical protein EU529_11145 [Promethearchaeota archaeon]|nr:MAG: hypothetical protein EU529_11145 [Candidatus Lokiarchaeota archaeon]